MRFRTCSWPASVALTRPESLSRVFAVVRSSSWTGWPETLERWRALKRAASKAIVSAGGTISHQHGVGADHREYLKAEKGSVGIDTMRSVWSYLDPDERMNPGKTLPEADKELP